MDPRALQLSARAAEHLRAALFLILPAASALALPAAAAEGDPEPPVSIGALRAAAGERVDHGTADDGAVWSRAASYRAGFERGGTSFVPFLGSRAPRNFPVRFRLESIARGGAAVAFDADVAPERTEDTVHFARGGVVEVYELRPAQVEQLFVLGALPAAGGDLVLSIGVDTELEGGTTADGIEFRNTLGAVRYGAAVAIDATGRRVEAPTAYADGAIEIRVPGAWLAHARMPLTIDPVISTFAVDATTEDDFAPDVAYDADTNRYLVVYEEVFSASDHDVVATLLTSTGALVASGFVDSPLAANWRSPRVANNHAADQFLVVANGPLSGVSVPVVGRTTPASGLAFGPVITIASDGFAPDVGGDPFPTAPSHYGVVFERAVEGLGQLVFFQLVRTDGTLGSSTNLDLGLPSTARPAISSSNSGVHWNLLWRDLPTATNGNVLGAQVRWDGVVITPPFTVDASASHDLNAQPSAPMEDADRWVVAFDRTGGGGNRNVVCKLLEGTTVLDTIDVSAAENAPAIGDQFEPAIDTDGQCVAVAYTQFVSFPSADEGVRVATLAPVGNQLLLSEGQIALGSSATVDENRARIVSTAGSGDAVGRFMAVFEVETGGTAFGDIGGGLYASDDFTSFCSPGADGVIACPCANPGGAGRGCANSSNANGGQLTAAGSTVPDSVVLTASGVTPTGTCVFTQGTTVLATAVAFGDGVRCAGGTLKRLYVKSATGGVAAAPSGADPTITARSAALGDPIAAGTTRAYYVFYRDPAVFACSSTFNSTNAILVQW